MKKLTTKEITTQLQAYPAWIYDDEAVKVVSAFEFENFTQAMEFVNGIAELAAELNHHPDILLHDYKFVTVFISTEVAKGITGKDFELVAKIESELIESAS